MMATITKQSMEGKGPLSFEQILSDPVNLNYFKNFCAAAVSTRFAPRPWQLHARCPPTMARL